MTYPVETEMLDFLISNIPLEPPYQAGEGQEAVIADLYPDLSEEELDYVMARYSGTMKRSKVQL